MLADQHDDAEPFAIHLCSEAVESMESTAVPVGPQKGLEDFKSKTVHGTVTLMHSGPFCQHFGMSNEGLRAYLGLQQRLLHDIVMTHNKYLKLKGGDEKWTLQAEDLTININVVNDSKDPLSAVKPSTSSQGRCLVTTVADACQAAPQGGYSLELPLGKLRVTPAGDQLQFVANGMELKDSAGKRVKLVHWDTGKSADETDAQLTQGIMHFKNVIASVHNAMLGLRQAQPEWNMLAVDVVGYTLRPGDDTASECQGMD